MMSVFVDDGQYPCMHEHGRRPDLGSCQTCATSLTGLVVVHLRTNTHCLAPHAHAKPIHAICAIIARIVESSLHTRCHITQVCAWACPSPAGHVVDDETESRVRRACSAQTSDHLLDVAARRCVHARAREEMSRNDTPLRHQVLHRAVHQATEAAPPSSAPSRRNSDSASTRRRGLATSSGCGRGAAISHGHTSARGITFMSAATLLVVALVTAALLTITAQPVAAVQDQMKPVVRSKLERWVSTHGRHGLPFQATYDRKTKTVMCVSPKGGSSSFYAWLYTVSTNGQDFYEHCQARKPTEHPSNFEGRCWSSYSAPIANATRTANQTRTHRIDITSARLNTDYPSGADGTLGETTGEVVRTALSREEQEAIVADPDVFWFAIVRDPIERAISAWKSKLACDGW
jgi:hypothetical protein